MDDQPNVVESPIALLPDLNSWGIEEVDKGVCEDTSENRRIIREFKARYQPVYAQDGSPTPYIQVITSAMRQAALGASKSVLLKDDRNPDSDYISGILLVIEPAADHIVPAWVIAATRHWLDVAEKRKENPTYRPALLGPPSRCAAKKVDGHRCSNWTNGTKDYGAFCRLHLSNRPSGEDESAGHLARARNRLQSAADMAVEVLEEMALNATGENVRVQAANSLLDRAGVRGGVEIDSKITVTVNAADMVRERLEGLRAGAQAKQELEARIAEEDIIDAEVIEETVR